MIEGQSARNEAGELRALAFALFGNEDGRTFWETPHPMLNGRAPAEAVAEPASRAEVERILRALEHGLPV
jgi:uncharacterized protein (DUF2384 family)